ncbi:hypothetical protein [Lapillicoccus sp.]|uniref:hypothetical protein n=1 Tax=Lapillicoccus sp. TaxID=1909287 RepID=UPI002600C6A7|nr:hypothetical protein [Lapillicoccus sp.]
MDDERPTSPPGSIPDTPMLDRAQQLRGWRINKMAMGLGEPENRHAFLADERAYLDRFGLTDEEVDAVTQRDWKRMIALGGNLFFVLKISAVDPVRMTEIGAAQVDMEHTAFLRDRLGKDG